MKIKTCQTEQEKEYNGSAYMQNGGGNFGEKWETGMEGLVGTMWLENVQANRNRNEIWSSSVVSFSWRLDMEAKFQLFFLSPAFYYFSIESTFDGSI